MNSDHRALNQQAQENLQQQQRNSRIEARQFIWHLIVSLAIINNIINRDPKLREGINFFLFIGALVRLTYDVTTCCLDPRNTFFRLYSPVDNSNSAPPVNNDNNPDPRDVFQRT